MKFFGRIARVVLVAAALLAKAASAERQGNPEAAQSFRLEAWHAGNDAWESDGRYLIQAAVLLSRIDPKSSVQMPLDFVTDGN